MSHATLQRLYNRPTVAGSNKYSGLAIVNDVFNFRLLQAPTDRSEIQSGALSSPTNFEKIRMVLQQYCDVVTTLQSEGAK